MVKSKDWVFAAIFLIAFVVIAYLVITNLSFFTNNWISLLVTLIISILIAYFFNYLSSKREESAEKERGIQAKSRILDILENKIINKQEITREKIERLIKSSSRKYSTNLLLNLTPESLLEDLELLFEESHHLDPNQKQEYSDKLNQLLINIVNTQSNLIYPNEKIFDDIIESVNSGNNQRFLDNLMVLKEEMLKLEDFKQTFYKHNDRSNSFRLIAITLTIFSLFISIITLQINQIPDNLLYILLGGLTGIITGILIIYYMKLRDLFD